MSAIHAPMFSGGGDPYWGSVVLLMNFTGSDTSTTFTDEKGHAFTPYGSAQISSTEIKTGLGSSGLINTNGSYVVTPYASDLSLGGVDFTIEAFVRVNTISQSQVQFCIGKDLNCTADYFFGGEWCLRNSSNTANKFSLFLGNGDLPKNSSGSVLASSAAVAGTTYFLSVHATGGVASFYIDGVLQGTATTANMVNSSRDFDIGYHGANYTAIPRFNIDSLRVTKNICRPVVVPTAPFPNY